ncbi:S-adenosyl-L-methionine-dependent methyltransferase [Lasiosphaeria hispida]|uniref:S-adenosyl-L-methionine-dependent methyltransferase n=1 Tax=Lasiosphaeria hispida TaxID=260671 RepID=A0AAJ0HS98_9PEZI|nr:S-adenosyl-L-methionine-dependent methyltransferase [Lasiosphaeria hispida]
MSTAEGPVIEFDPRVVGDLNNEEGSVGDTSSLRDSTASITSSIYEYRTINGRSYQSSKTTEYWAPTDEKHVGGFDIAHEFVILLMGGKLFAAPIGDNPKKILDVGTGTGIWAIDMADGFPSASVIGTDISAVQPSWVPPNCSFQIDDAQLDWTFKKAAFDFIHIRELYGGIDDWQKLYRQAFDHLEPGGWLEALEIDIETRSENPKVANDEGHIFKTWCRLFWEAGDKTGRTFRIARDGRMGKYFKEAGFVDVVHRQWKVPIGGWPQDPTLKRVGQYNGLFIDRSLDGFAVFPVGEIMGWSRKEVDELVKNMRIAIADPKSLPYYNIHLVYGRKPAI